MEQRLSLITLGVADLGRSRRFYEAGLGWKPSPAGNESVTFYPLGGPKGGMVLGLYPYRLLAEDALQPSERPSGFGGITIAYNTRSRDETDAVLKQAEAAGARLVKPAQDVFWGGYSGYFADPDGYFFEVAWNPYWSLDADGRIRLPR